MTMPLDRNRPLWHMYMVDGFGDGAAIITRMHHCIADGIALARVMLSLTDSEPDAGVGTADERPAAARPRRCAPAWPDPARPALAWTRGRLGTRCRAPGRADRHVARHAASLAGAVGRDAGDRGAAAAHAGRCRHRDQGRPRRQPAGRLEHAAVADGDQATRPPHDATVNDVLLAAVSGALRHYLQDRGSAVAEIQAMVPFNLRPLDEPVPQELGNKFGLVFLPLPVGTSGSYRRLVEVHRRMDEIKDGRDGPVSYGDPQRSPGSRPEPVERRIVDMFSAQGHRGDDQRARPDASRSTWPGRRCARCSSGRRPPDTSG